MTNSILEKIKPEEITHISLGKTSGVPHILIITNNNNNNCDTYPLTAGINIHIANELLRSLKIYPDECIYFESYVQYSHQIDLCNHLLEYRRIMEELTQKRYDKIDILAYQVYSVILDRLLAKHHMEKAGYSLAIQKRPLDEWIAEALKYFK